MFTINTQWALGKSGVMWEGAISVSPNAIQDQIDTAKKAPNPIDALKTLIAELQKPIMNEVPQVTITREEKIKECQKALDGILAEAKKKEQKLNADALENTDFVRKFGNRVNLGAVVPFIEKQTGNTTRDKIQAAFNKAKSNTTRSDAGTAISIDQEYAMKSKMSDKGGLHLSEYNALATLLESMLKSQTVFDDLKAKNIPSDRKVDSSKLVDLFADFDGDGVIEAVNSVNDAGLWNKFKSIFVDLDGTQSDHLGEHQAINKMKDETTLKEMLTKIGVEQAKGEDLKDFAKRARAALMMSASVSGTAELDPSKALARMQKSDKYKEEHKNIEKQVADLEQKITNKNPNIKPEDANKIARSLTSIVTVYTTSIGTGSANVDAIMQQLGQAIATPKGNTTFLGIDMGVMAKVVNTEKFKVSLGAGLGGGVSSEGFFAFAHVGAEGKLTMIDRSTLEDIKKSEGNMTATLGVHAGMDLKSFRVVPALTLDALWNDKIDSLENAMLKMNTIIDKLTVVGTDGKITLDLSKLPANLDPVLRAQLSSLKYLAENVDPKMTPAQQNTHAILIRDRFMQSFKVFMAAQPEYKGFSLAGIRFAVVPGAFLLGPVFQDISVERKAQVVQGEKRRAETTEKASIMSEFGLSWDSATRTLTRDEANKTKITLAEGLKWDEKDLKVVFLDGKIPKFTVDTGVVNTLGGRGEKTLIVSSVDTKTSTSTTPTEAKAEALKSDVALPQGIPAMIQALPINKLIERSDVKKFMKAMTENPFIQQKAAEAAAGVKEFKAIITKANVGKDDAEKFQNILNTMIEIDEKLVGDQITRGFNAAKTDKKAFDKYKVLLRTRGAKLSKSFSQDSMTLGDIAGVSFDKKGLRDQELNLIATATGINSATLKTADTAMINEIKNQTTLTTEGSGYMTMARNRRGLSGARGYETGSYIMKKDLGLTPDQNIHAMQKGMGKDLVKIALTNLASRNEFASYKDEINTVNSSKVTLTAGKATVDLGGSKTLTIDLSASKVYSALYGDTAMTSAEQAVCVNVATLYEPSVAGTITENGKTTSVPEMDITDSDTVMLPEVRTSQVAILGAVPNKKKDAPQENQQNPDSKPTTDTNGEIKPPPGGSPVITPPQPATPVNIPEVITPVTPGANGPKIK